MASTPIPVHQRIELVEAVLELLMMQAADADHRPGYAARRRLTAIYKAWDDRYEDLLLLRLEQSLEEVA